jgi:hypothetical protein
MKRLTAIVAMTAGWLVAGAVLMPAGAVPFGPGSRLTEEPVAMPARWVCDRVGNCVWRGPGRRTFYYGPANWRHCDYRWRTGRRGPYRERLCW